MTRIALPILGWALLAAGITEALMIRVDEPSSTSGNRSLFYALDEDTSVTVRLAQGESDLALSMALEVLEPPARDEAQTWTWGVQLRLQPHQGEEVTHDLWLRSRRSLLENGAERIHGARAGQILTDIRRVDLPLADLAPEGGLLTLSPLLGESAQRLHLRVESRQRPDAATLAQHLRSGSLMGSRASRMSPFPWTSLDDVERIRLASADARPVGAEHLSGTTRALHRLGPIHPAPTTNPRGLRLEPGQATQITLIGPCRIEVEARNLVDQGTVELDLDRFVVHEEIPSTDTGMEHADDLIAAPGDLVSLRWNVPLESDPVSLSLTAHPSPECLWGVPPGSGSEQSIAPETRRLTAWHLAPESDPLEIPLATGGSHGRLKVKARPLPPAGWSPETDVQDPLLTRLRYQLVGNAGQVLVEGAFDAPFLPTPLEHRIEPAASLMSEATSIQILHPPEATHLRLTTDSPVDLRFLVPLDPGHRDEAYALPSKWKAHNAPWVQAPYVSVAPSDAESLAEDHRLVRFDATVRPVPEKKVPTPGAWRTRTVVPEGRNESHLISEPVRRNRRLWQAWDRTRLAPSNQLVVPESGRVRVDYRVDPLASGRPITLRCGETAVTSRLPAAASTIHFDGLPTGAQDCQLTAPIGRYLANVPGDGRKWARRRVVRGDLHDLEVIVQVPAGGTTLYVRSYTPEGRAAPTLEAEVDHGNPRRRYGQVERITPAVVSGRPAARGGDAWMEDRASGALIPRRALYIPLGDDLLSGAHRVRIRVTRNDGPVYLRFDAGSAPEPLADTSPRWEMDGR
jgi:hypothetical protein